LSLTPLVWWLVRRTRRWPTHTDHSDDEHHHTRTDEYSAPAASQQKGIHCSLHSFLYRDNQGAPGTAATGPDGCRDVHAAFALWNAGEGGVELGAVNGAFAVWVREPRETVRAYAMSHLTSAAICSADVVEPFAHRAITSGTPGWLP